MRSTRERIPCTKEEFDNYYHNITLFRQRAQYHGRCVCPRRKWLDCDMDCQTCPFHKNGTLSLDYITQDDDGDEHSWCDAIPDPTAVVDVTIEEQELQVALRTFVFCNDTEIRIDQ